MIPTRPTRRYYLEFRHPEGRVIKTYTLGQTPCLAKQAGFNQMERLKAIDKSLPQDNQWALSVQRDEGVVGVR